jgi:transposase
MLALALILDGVDRDRAAQTCGMQRQTLRDWVHRYNEHGLEGLINRKAPGVPPGLTSHQRQQLAALVDAGPDLEKDGVVRWRRIDLQKKIKDMFGVEMHERTVGKHLAALGYRKLSVRPQHPKSDPQAQEAFKKTLPTR